MILTSPVDLSPLLVSPEEISARDVTEFRREIFRDGLVSRYEADALFMINEAVLSQCSEWDEFYVEALTDFTVHQMEPRGYISVENGEWIIRQVQKNGSISLANELELLIRLIEKADECPHFVVGFTLHQVALLVLEGEGELIDGKEVRKGVIGPAECELLRRVLYGVSGENSIGISQYEAEILFDLNDKTVEQENHPAWNALFVRAIANYLMAYSGYELPDRQTAFAREAWLEDTEIDVAGALTKTLSSFGSLFRSETFADIFKSDHRRVEEAFREKNELRELAVSEAERISEVEAHWLVEKIGKDGILHENEKALIEFLKKESPQLHPALKPLLDKVG